MPARPYMLGAVVLFFVAVKGAAAQAGAMDFASAVARGGRRDLQADKICKGDVPAFVCLAKCCRGGNSGLEGKCCASEQCCGAQGDVCCASGSFCYTDSQNQKKRCCPVDPKNGLSALVDCGDGKCCFLSATDPTKKQFCAPGNTPSAKGLCCNTANQVNCGDNSCCDAKNCVTTPSGAGVCCPGAGGANPFRTICKGDEKCCAKGGCVNSNGGEMCCAGANAVPRKNDVCTKDNVCCAKDGCAKLPGSVKTVCCLGATAAKPTDEVCTDGTCCNKGDCVDNGAGTKMTICCSFTKGAGAINEICDGDRKCCPKGSCVSNGSQNICCPMTTGPDATKEICPGDGVCCTKGGCVPDPNAPNDKKKYLCCPNSKGSSNYPPQQLNEICKKDRKCCKKGGCDKVKMTCGPGGSVVNDPIVGGFHGCRFHFQGLPNKHFSLLGDAEHSVAALFVPEANPLHVAAGVHGTDGTWLSRMGLAYKEDVKVVVTAIDLHQNLVVTANGQQLDFPTGGGRTRVGLSEGVHVMLHDDRAGKAGSHVLHFVTPTYEIHIWSLKPMVNVRGEGSAANQHTPALSFDVKVRALAPCGAYGVLGDTMKRANDEGAGTPKYCEAFKKEIAGRVDEYLVTDLFADDSPNADEAAATCVVREAEEELEGTPSESRRRRKLAGAAVGANIRWGAEGFWFK